MSKENRNVGVIEQAIGPRGLPGAKGDTGEQGVQGERGERGPTGLRGPAGTPGSRGPQGERGPTGVTGRTGERGLQGVQGERGEIGPPSMSSAFDNTVMKINAATADVHLLMLGDSTLLGNTPWPNKLGDLITAPRPQIGLITHRWNGLTESWESPVQVRSGSSGFNLHVWNGSYSGRVAMYYIGRLLKKLVIDIPADAIILSQGFNMPGTPSFFRGQYVSATEKIRSVKPDADFAVVAQNATTDTAMTNTQRIKVAEVRRVARERGYGLIDIFRLYSSQPGGVPESWVEADKFHPTTPAGTTAIAQEASNHFVSTDTPGPRVMNPSSLHEFSVNLLKAGLLNGYESGTPNGWNAPVGSATYAKDEALSETKGYSLKVTSTSASSYVSLDVPANLLQYLKGKRCSVTAYISVGITQAANVGSLGVDFGGDGSNVVQTANSDGQGGFRPETFIFDVPETATRIRVRLYAATSGIANGGTFNVDRVVMSLGNLPRDDVAF